MSPTAAPPPRSGDATPAREGPVLVVEDSLSRLLAQVPLEGQTLVIGRDPDCEVALASPYISRRHACIEPGDGGWLLRPYGLNGTYLNQHLVREDEARPLRTGDVISLPGFTLRVVGPAQADTATDAVALMRRYSELKARLHEELLARVDLRSLTGGELEEEGRVKRIRAAMGEILDRNLEVTPDLAAFVVAEAFRRRLLDMVIGRRAEDQATGQRGSEPWRLDPQQQAFDDFVYAFGRRLGCFEEGVPVRDRLATVGRSFGGVFEDSKTSMTADLYRFVIRQALRLDLEALVFGLGPLEDLLRMPDLTEIMVIGRDKIFVEQGGRLEETGRSFPSDEDLEVVIGRIVAPIGRFVNRSQPIVDARLSDGSRVNIVIPPVSIRGPAITIRKFRAEPFSIDDLVAFGTLNRRALAFLRGCVLARKNLVISGGTGSGKTTLLNTLSSQIPAPERIVVIEDAAELQLQQPNQVVLEAKKANVEGEGEISIRDLVRSALRMRPDRIIVGECRGKEALDMLQAMNTGHDGSLTTAHANSPEELISRLEVMVLEAGEALPVAAIHRQIAGAVDVVVQIQRQRDRARRITYVSEVVGYDAEEERIVIEDIFRLAAPAGGDGTPELRFTGYLPTFIDELLERGDTRLEELF